MAYPDPLQYIRPLIVQEHAWQAASALWVCIAVTAVDCHVGSSVSIYSGGLGPARLYQFVSLELKVRENLMPYRSFLQDSEPLEKTDIRSQ